MIWLKELGWDSRDSQGLSDAVNFALAMSYSRPSVVSAEKQPPQRQRDNGPIGPAPEKANVEENEAES